MAFGATTTAVPAIRQEYVLRGFKLALEHHIKDEKLLKFVQSEILDSPRKSSPISLMSKLTNRGAKIIFGFSSSHEALLTAPIARATDTILITSASHDDLSSFGPNIHSIGVSISEVSKKLTEIISNKYRKPEQKGLLIEKIDSVFSVSFTKKISNNFNTINKVSLIKGCLSQDVINSLKTKKYSFLVLSMYPEEASSLMLQLANEKVSLPVFVNHTWSTADPILVRGYLSEYREPIFTLGYYAPGSRESYTFEQLAKRKYGSFVLTDMACGWDHGTIASQLIQTSYQKTVSIQDAFKSKKCFEGTTSGKLCFSKTGGFSDRALHFLKYDYDKGFRIAPE